MKSDARESRWLGHTTAFSATLILGIAIAVVHNRVVVQANQKSGSGKNAPPAAAAKPKADAPKTKETTPSRRGHALGMTIEGDENQGMTVSEVEESGPAARAGIKAKDRIVSVDNRTFKRSRQLEAYLASHGGRPIPVVVLRDGQPQTITYTPPHRAGDSAWLGVYLEDSDDAKGAQVGQVYPTGPAARAGIHSGDTITRVDDEKIETAADLISTIANLAPQTQTQFTILRNDQEQKLDVTLGAHHAFAPQGTRPAAGGAQQQHEAGNDAFDNVPPYTMQLEHDRRLAEQHQRIENEIRALREEIRQLREELKDRK